MSKRRRLKLRIKDILLIGLILFVFTSILISIVQGNSNIHLNVQLLWEKEFQKHIYGVRLASGVGNKILVMTLAESEEDSDRILILNNYGEIITEKVLPINRGVISADIAPDGNYFVYLSAYDEEYSWMYEDGEPDDRIHYCHIDGNEIWNKGGEPYPGLPWFSHDGSMIITTPWLEGYANRVYAFDSLTGNLLWKVGNPDWDGMEPLHPLPFFSQDGNYIGLSHFTSYFLKKDGTVLKKLVEPIDGLYPEINSISNNGEYISAALVGHDAAKLEDETWLFKGVLYDKNFNIVLKEFGYISADGSKFIKVAKDKITIIRMPDKTILGEYPITHPVEIEISYDGKIVVVAHEKIEPYRVKPTKLTIINSAANEIWEKKINEGIGAIYLTKDGKYLLVDLYGEKIWYYQLY